MRSFINLFENQTPFTLDDQFVAHVQEYLEEHLSDWADRFTDLKGALQKTWDLIESEGVPENGSIEVYREELRPAEQIEHHNYGTLGACWSWDLNGAETCHHDNAYDEFGQEVEPVVFIANVSLRDVNWVQTMAKNLVLKNEREINIRDGATVHIEGQMKPGGRGYTPSPYSITIDNMNDF